MEKRKSNSGESVGVEDIAIDLPYRRRSITINVLREHENKRVFAKSVRRTDHNHNLGDY